MTDITVVELIGVYNADGGLVGEAKYVIGHLLGTAHCSLCDITHSPVRRKPAWDAMVRRLGVYFGLVHLNEMSPDVSELVSSVGSPLVAARLSNGTVVALLDAAELDGLGGSVDSAEQALRAAITTKGWSLASSSPA